MLHRSLDLVDKGGNLLRGDLHIAKSMLTSSTYNQIGLLHGLRVKCGESIKRHLGWALAPLALHIGGLVEVLEAD